MTKKSRGNLYYRLRCAYKKWENEGCTLASLSYKYKIGRKLIGEYISSKLAIK